MTNNLDRVKALFDELLDEASFELPEAEKWLIDDLLDNFEYGLALEVLVDAVRQHRIPLTRQELTRIKALGQKTKLDPNKWQELQLR